MPLHAGRAVPPVAMSIAVRILLVTLLAGAIIGQGRAQDTTAQTRDVVPYHQFTSYEGLANESITALAQTNDERLWIGTETGLSVFDSHTFRSVAMPDEIGTVYVSDIQPADSSSVWVAASVGDVVRVRSDSVEQVISLGDELVQRILPGPDTTRFVTRTAIWTWTSGADTATRQPYAYPIQTPLDASQPSDMGAGVFNADVHPNGETWVVDGRRGPGVLQPNGSVSFVEGGPTGSPGAFWYTLRIADNGRVFALHDESVYRIDPDPPQRVAEEPLTTDLGDPTYLAVQGNDVYVTRDRRIERYDARALRLQEALGAEHGLPDLLMARVFQDARDGLWIGTPEGLLYLRAPHVRHKKTAVGGTSIQNVMTFLPQHNDLWIRTYGSGLVQLYPDEQQVRPGDQVGWRQRVESASDTLHALASETRAWYRKAPDASWTRVRETRNAIHGVVDRTGTGYFVQDNGLYRYAPQPDATPEPIVTWPDSVSYQHDLTLAPNGDLVHRNGATLLRRRPPTAAVVDTLGTLTSYAHDEASTFDVNARSNMRHMTVDAAGRVWASFMYDGGVVRVDTDGATRRVLSNRRVWRVDTVGDSLALASTRQHGLYVLNAETGAVQRQLTEANGLQSSNVMAAHVALDSLHIGHSNGITKLPLRALKQTEQPPRTLLTGVEVNLDDRPAVSTLELEASDRSLGFSFTGVHFADSQSMRYEYRLLPRDTTWSATGQGFTRYTNLEPGSYQFEVRARLNDRPPGPAATYAFQIPAHFYEMRSVQLVAVLVLLLGGWGGYRWRIRRLRRYQQVLEEMVQTRTTELRKEKQKTEAQAERLAELDNAKNRFFAHISHEFRTPLVLLLSPLKDTLRNATDGAVALSKAQVNRMVRNAEHLQRLINQLLDLATLQAGRMTLNRQPGRLDTLVQRTADAFQSKAQEKDITFTVEADDTPLETQFDPDKMETIVRNLVSNALKYTPPGGRVTVRVEQRPEHATARITVADTGTGIRSEDQDRIFARFERGAENAADAQHDGLGLGLTLTKELVALHDGTIQVESTPDTGSTFVIDVPLHPVVMPNSDEEDPDLAYTPAEASEDDGHSLAPLPDEHTTTAEQEASASKETLLVVEDNADMRGFLREELAAHWTIRTAANGAEGWAAVQADPPDLVLCDVMMPEMSGFALCESIKQDDSLRTIPVLLLTARATDDATLKGLRCGADDYVTKPFDIQEVKQRIANHLAAREHLRGRFEEQVTLSSIEASIDRPMLPFMETITETIDEHLDNPDFTVDQLAEAVALSRRQCTRRLKDAVDMTPAVFIRHRRIEYAKTLLETDPETIAEVAYSVGFRSPSHFSKVFREATGQSPSAYRDAVTENDTDSKAA